MADFDIKRGDTYPFFQALLEDKNGPVDLTGAEVRLLLKTKGTTPTIVVNQIMTIVTDQLDNPDGPYNVEYEWAPADTASVQDLDGEIQVTWGDGEITSFPKTGFFSVSVTPDLGP